MSKVHDSEDADDQGAPSPQALAEELSIECPVCQAPEGSWCQKQIGFDVVDGLHARRAEVFKEIAKANIGQVCPLEIEATEIIEAYEATQIEAFQETCTTVTRYPGNIERRCERPADHLGAHGASKPCTKCGWHHCACAREDDDMKKTPIDSLKKKYNSHVEHLLAIEDAIVKQFNIPEGARAQVRKAVAEAFDVGHRTTTSDDWCDLW